MKILMINVVCGIRSTGRICTDLADALTEQGHTVKIAYGREDVPEKYKKYAYKIGTNLDVKLHGLKARLFDAAGFGSKRATIKFIEWVKKYDPDVIHLHNIHGYYINVEVLFDYLRTCGKKIIWTLHDCWAVTGHCSHFTYVKCNKWRNGCHSCPQKKEYPKSILADKSQENWEKKKTLFTTVKKMVLVTPSCWLAQIVKESYLTCYPVRVLYNGIDTEVFKPMPSNFREKYGLQDKIVLLGVSSTWNQRKGFNDFIKLAEKLDDRYTIILVGLSDKQKLMIPENIIGITCTNSIKELAEIYSAADVFINLSVEETFGLTTIEAQACGTPAIVYNSTALPEFISDNNGVAIPTEITTDALIDTIKRIVKSPYNKNDLIKSASNLDKQRMVERYLEIYE